MFWSGNRAYGLYRLAWRYNGAKLYFSWPYMIVSMIWNTSELSALHLSRATDIFVVDCCEFGPSWMFGLKMELMACANLVGGIKEQICIFLTLYDSMNDMQHFWTVCIRPQPCHIHFCCWLLPMWPKLDFWAENGAYGLCRLGWRYIGAKLYFPWHYMIVSMIWNSSELSASHLSRSTVIFVVDCCQFGPSWIFGLKTELMTCADLVDGTTEQICSFTDLIW